MNFMLGMLLVCAVQFDGPVIVGHIVGLSKSWLFLQTEKKLYRISTDLCAEYKELK